MLKKIDWSKQFIQEQLEHFACPYCGGEFLALEGYSLVCEKRHRFDINKKGTLHLMKQKANEDYDANLFDHRYQLAQSGFFLPLLEQVCPLIEMDGEQLLVDIGCGEGSHLAVLSQKIPSVPMIGMDIAKEGIQAASLHFAGKALWIVADLAQLPFADESCGTLLNMLTPSNYQEFKRVLASEGKLIKIIPGSDYLLELRQQLYRSRQEKQQYSNQDIVERFAQDFPNMQLQEVRYQVELTAETYQHLLQMTPLYWGATQEDRHYSEEHPLKKVTVHLWILVGQKCDTIETSKKLEEK